MRCSELIERLFSYSGRSKFNKTLSRMQCIDEWQGQPHRRFMTIHVAGTNGKGSVAFKIAHALQAAHFNVGLYTSPHISSFRERILVNQSMISEEFIADYLPKLFRFIEEQNMTPSFFELLTALAFEYFACKKIDIAVVEVGLGGEFDATNIILPRLSVITSISYDHMEILGQTLDDIARAKAGIIKEGVPVIIGPHARFAPILLKAQSNAILVPPVTGFYDDENNAIARDALRKMGVSDDAIHVGLQQRPSCRFEIVDPRPIIFDVAHNVDGFSHLREAVDAHYSNVKFNVVLATGNGKDPVPFMEKMGSIVHKIACISNEHARLADANDVLERLKMKGYSNAHVISSIKEVLKMPEPILVCGSFFIMNDVRRQLIESKKKSVRFDG